MNNQRQGSRTPMVGQNAPTFPDPATVKLPLTSKQAKTTSYFLEMARAVQVHQTDTPPPVPAAVDAFLKQECSELDKIMAELEARRDADAARAEKLEAQKCEAQRRREERRTASLEAQQAPYKRLQDFTPSADMPAPLRACYAPRRLKVKPTAPPCC
ncbi:hypothetical protein ACFP9V_23890 [Deinococcus radiopugnans]